MNTPTFSELTSLLVDAQSYLVGAASALTMALIVMAVKRTVRPRTDTAPDTSGTSTKTAASPFDNKLTFVVAVIVAGVSAQGMWRFFRDTLHFPVELRIVAFAVLELVTFVCALRARRNIREAKTPEDAKAGVDGAAVWVVTAMSGVFSATDAKSWPEGLFRLLMPLLAAWLWERGMSIERQRIRKKHNEDSNIHLRITPERVLVWLRVAEPSGRTASEVDAHRRLTKVAKAVRRLRRLRKNQVKAERIQRAEARVERAVERAVVHANLSLDPARQRALIAQLGALCNAAALADLTPDAPWAGFAAPSRQTFFEAMGVPIEPAALLPPVGDASSAKMDDGSGGSSGDNTPPPVGDKNDRQEPPVSGDNNDEEAGDNSGPELAASKRQRPARSGGKTRRRKARRSMTEWVELAAPIFHSEFERLKRNPTGDEFAEAIKKSGLGTVSASTAKNIRTEILDRSPLPTLD